MGLAWHLECLFVRPASLAEGVDDVADRVVVQLEFLRNIFEAHLENEAAVNYVDAVLVRYPLVIFLDLGPLKFRRLM